MTLPFDCIAVGLAILVFSILLWGVGRMIDQRLAHMETSLVGLGQQMTAALHAIERFLNRQEARDQRSSGGGRPAE